MLRPFAETDAEQMEVRGTSFEGINGSMQFFGAGPDACRSTIGNHEQGVVRRLLLKELGRRVQQAGAVIVMWTVVTIRPLGFCFKNHFVKRFLRLRPTDRAEFNNRDQLILKPINGEAAGKPPQCPRQKHRIPETILNACSGTRPRSHN